MAIRRKKHEASNGSIVESSMLILVVLVGMRLRQRDSVCLRVGIFQRGVLEQSFVEMSSFCVSKVGCSFKKEFALAFILYTNVQKCPNHYLHSLIHSFLGWKKCSSGHRSKKKV